MPFPHYIKGWFSKKPDGWEDLGPVQGELEHEHGRWIEIYRMHKFCKSKVHVGRADGTVFRFCPRCMVVTNVLNGSKTAKRKKKTSRRKR